MTEARLGIALVAPWFEVPPRAYGGIEALVADLAKGLIDRGHDVVVIGAGEFELEHDFSPPTVNRLQLDLASLSRKFCTRQWHRRATCSRSSIWTSYPASLTGLAAATDIPADGARRRGR